MDTNHRDEWVEERLAALRPSETWQPDRFRGLARFHERQGQSRRSQRGWRWIAAAAMVAVPLAAFPTTREFAQRCVSACVGQSGWVRGLFAAGAAPSSVYVKPEERRMAPDFVLEDASGTPVRLSELRGQVVLLNFWATWCAPCRIEIPWFIEFQKANESRGFTTLGVSLDEDGWAAVRPFVDERKVNYRVMIGNDEVSRLYGAASLPATFIIDKAGRIAATHVGICGKNEYESDIQAVLQER